MHPVTLAMRSLLAVSAPDNAPPGIFLRIFILGGFAVTILLAWLALRGYRDTGGKNGK